MIGRPADQRRAGIAEACGSDVLLHDQMEALLESYDEEADLEIFLRQHQESDLPSDGTKGYSTDATRTAPGGDDREAASGSREGITQWGRFTLLEEIGRGGFGLVYRAWESPLKRDVALKIVDVRRLPGLQEEAWLREGQMLARVNHQNVVKVYSAERIGSEVGLAMEFIKGRTLSDLLLQHGPLGTRAGAQIGVALCDALAAVHRVGLVHRDLKASNVMRESGGRIVLMDFGAGRELMRAPDTFTRLLGTPSYMAPEVLAGSSATPGSDIYSLGALLFHLLTQRHPFPGSEFVELLEAHSRGERVQLTALRSDLPSDFVTAIDRALDLESSRRPTAVALRRDLAAVAETRRKRANRPPNTITTHRPDAQNTQPPPPPRIRSTAVLQRWSATVVGCLLLLLGLGTVTTLEFNAVLDRTGEFASESLLSLLTWGFRSIVGPLIYLGILVVLFNAAAITARLLGTVLPSLRDRLLRGRILVRGWLTRKSLYEANVFMRALALFGLLVLVATLWLCRPLLNALGTSISDGSTADLARLNLDENVMPVVYRRLLEINLVLLSSGALAVGRLRRPDQPRISVSAWLSVVVIGSFAVLFLAAPWRIIFASRFPTAQIGGEQCFVVGRSGTQFLLHCPARKPPRNTLIETSAPGLELSRRPVELFTSYPTVK